VNVGRAIAAAAEGPLRGWLHGQRWFGAKGRDIRRIVPRDHAVLDAGGGGRPAYVLVLFEIVYEDGEDLYAIPLVVGTGGASGADGIIGEIEVDGARLTLCDALADHRFLRLGLATIARNGTVPTERGGALVGTRGAALASFVGSGAIEDLPVRAMRAEQSNTSVVFSPGGQDRLLVKWLRSLHEGVHLEVEIGAHLAKVGFHGAPKMLGDLAYIAPPRAGVITNPVTLAVAAEFVANVSDGWKHALSDVKVRLDSDIRVSRPSREPYDNAIKKLGRLTAEMHLALANGARDPAFAPEPLTEGDRGAIALSAATRLVESTGMLERRMPKWDDTTRALAKKLVADAPSLADRVRSATHLPQGLVKTRIHGDYHLGQVLRTHGEAGTSGWTIVDFEGEPARPLADRRKKSSPLRDVAGMLRSFDYAAHAALQEVGGSEKEAQSWRDAARQSYLDGWLEVASKSEHALVPHDAKQRADALSLFELDKALYELAYEVEHRPDWVAIPMRGILRMMHPER
jgi:maltose alpha-D-glucosyltransferase / alpha-amylase